MVSVQLNDSRSRWILVFVFIMISVNICLGQENRFIYHTPPGEATAGVDLEITGQVADPSAIREGILYFRTAGHQSFQEIQMVRSAHEFKGIIPGVHLSAAGLEYVILLHDHQGGSLAFPAEDPFGTPQFLAVQGTQVQDETEEISFRAGPREAIDAEILILNPGKGEILFTGEVVIAASYYFMPDIDSTTIRILLNELDVTSRAEIGEGVINYIAEDLEPGLHTVTLKMSTDLGEPVRPFSWSFTIGETRFNVQDYVEYNGNINSQVSTESVSGVDINVAEVSGRFNSNLKWLSMRSRFRLTTRESIHLQPYNRLSVDLYFGDYLTLQLGDVHPNLTAFLIDGQRVRGLGVTLSFDYFEFKMVSGDVNRPVQSLGTSDRGYYLLDNTAPDSTGALIYELDRRGYTFKRALDAYRLSFKWKKKFWLGVQFLKSMDDISSIDRIIGSGETFTVPEDTLLNGVPGGIYTYNEFQSQVSAISGSIKFKDKEWGGNNPVDNLVAGFHLGTALDDKRLNLEFNWNISLYNRNIWNGAMTLAEMDTALDDTLDGYIGRQYENDGSVVEGTTLASTGQIPDPVKYQSIFNISTFMTPLVPIDFLSLQEKPLTTYVNMPSSAFNLKLTGHYYLNNFTIEYRQVGPEYVTLGNPYLTKNIREFIATDRLSLLDRKLSLTFSFKHRDNKILKNPSNPLVTNTLTFGISLLPGPNSPSFTFNIQSIGQDNEREEKFENVGGILIDKREEYRTVNSLISVNFPFETGNIKNNLVINYNEIKNTDLLVDDRAQGYMFTRMDVKTYSGSFSSQPIQFLRTVLNYSRSESGVLVFQEEQSVVVPLVWSSYGVSGQYAMFGNKLRLLAGLSVLDSKGIFDNSIYSLRGGTEYNIIGGLAASLSGNMQLNRNNQEYDLTNSGLILSMKYRF